MGRTGVLTPVAVFEPIEIDGATVERASLHNVSVMREIMGSCCYAGQRLEVFKANQIIPQIMSADKMTYEEVVGNCGVIQGDRLGVLLVIYVAISICMLSYTLEYYLTTTVFLKDTVVTTCNEVTTSNVHYIATKTTIEEE